MELKILTDNLTELEANWYSFLARVMLAKELDDIVPELTALAELGEDRAITTWHQLFPDGKNEIIDNIVKDYPNMTSQQAVQNISDCSFDLQNAKSEVTIQELLKLMEDSSLALIKSYQNEPKISTIKELKIALITYLGFFINSKEVQNQLDTFLSNGSAQIEDLAECIGKLIKIKIKMKPEHKKILKQMASMPCCKDVENKFDERTKNV